MILSNSRGEEFARCSVGPDGVDDGGRLEYNPEADIDGADDIPIRAPLGQD